MFVVALEQLKKDISKKRMVKKHAIVLNKCNPVVSLQMLRLENIVTSAVTPLHAFPS